MLSEIRFCLLAVVLLATVGCGKKEPATFVHGMAPLPFPVRSEGILRDLAEPMLKDCETGNYGDKSECITFIQHRIDSCMPANEPAVYESPEQFRQFARPFSACLTATP